MLPRMDSTLRFGLAVGGCVAIGLGIVAGSYLAAETWTPGAIGFPLLLSLPGIWLLLRALGRAALNTLLAGTAAALALIGLDVVDSARTAVVVGGWSLAIISATGLFALAAVQRRPQRTRPADSEPTR